MPGSSDNIAWSIVKNVTAVMGGRAFLTLARFFVAVLVVRYSGVDGFGEYALVLSILLTIEWILDFGTTDVTVRAACAEPHRANELYRALAVSKIVLLVAALATTAGVAHFADFGWRFVQALAVGAAGLFFSAGLLMYRAYFRVNMRMEREALGEVVGMVTAIPFLWIACVNGWGLEVLIAVYSMSRAVSLAIVVWLAREWSPNPVGASRADVGWILKTSLPLGLAGILTCVYDRIDPILLAKLDSAEAVGLFSGAMRLAAPMLIAAQSIAATVYPLLSSLFRVRHNEFELAFRRVLDAAVVVGAFSLTLVYCGAEFIMGLLGEPMVAAAPVLRMLAWLVLARAIMTALSPGLIIGGGLRHALWMGPVSIAVKVGLIFWLVPTYGPLGAAIGYTTAEIVTGIVPMTIIVQRLVEFRVDWRVLVRVAPATGIPIALCYALGIEGTLLGLFAAAALFPPLALGLGAVRMSELRLLAGGVRKRFQVDSPRPAAAAQTRPAAGELKVAIACPGVGLVQRGFERLFADLFRVLRDDVDITLFKGGGRSDKRERRLRFLDRNALVVRYLPVHRLFGRSPLHTECLTFAFALLPRIVWGRYDVVHVIDPPLARVLFHLRNRLGLKFRLLYTEGTAMPPTDRPPSDHVHQVSLVAHDNALRHGISRSQQTLIPCGIDSARFELTKQREQLRREHGVSPDTFVILSVAAINRRSKRIDHLIEEAMRLEGDLLLWLDGSVDLGDTTLIREAKQRLGDRCRVTCVPSDRVGELYRLADVMVLCSLSEAFGLAVVEAASTGLPVLTHDNAHFRWLFPRAHNHVDMGTPGCLGERLAQLMQDRAELETLVRAEDVRQRFDWQYLKGKYLDLYREVASMPVQSASPLPRREPVPGLGPRLAHKSDHR